MRNFEYDVIVIGGGIAGLTAASTAARRGCKTLLVEKHNLGGDYLHTGCIPSKSLLACGKISSSAKSASQYGIKISGIEIRFSMVMDSIKENIKKSKNLIPSLDSVDCKYGNAVVVGKNEVLVGHDTTHTTAKIIIATGSKPFVPNILGVEKIKYYTSDTIWGLEEQPRKIAIIGGGVIGCEMAQAFARLGSDVTLFNNSRRLLSGQPKSVSYIMHEALRADGVMLRNHSIIYKVVPIGETKDSTLISYYDDKIKMKERFSHVMFCTGRTPNTVGFGLSAVGVEKDKKKQIIVNKYLQSTIDTIYAVGDVTTFGSFAHIAEYHGKLVGKNLSRKWWTKSKRVSFKNIPRVIYTDPEIATVGFTEQELIERDISYDLIEHNTGSLDRSIISHKELGILQVYLKKRTDRILGVVLVGPRAGDLISEYALAIQNRIGLKKFSNILYAYPTYSEANKIIADKVK